MSRAVTLGYASSDRAIRVGTLPAADETALVRARLSDPWPRPGGCGPGIAHALGSAGVDTACITWVADDAPGRALRAWLREAGVDETGVATTGTRSPEAMLLYDAEGACACVYDPGDATVEGLTDAQAARVAEADLVCVAVGYAAAGRAALDLARDDATVVWSVKADADAFDPDLARRLLERADVLALSRAEAPFVQRHGKPRPDALVVETAGAAGATWTRGDRAGHVPAGELPVADTTGAGDAFVGGLLAGLLADPSNDTAAVERAVATSAALLAARIDKGRPT